MEIGQFMWSSQTVVLSGKRGVTQRKKYSQCHPYRFLCQSSHKSHSKPGWSHLDVGDVESEMFNTIHVAGVTQSFLLKLI